MPIHMNNVNSEYIRLFLDARMSELGRSGAKILAKKMDVSTRSIHLYRKGERTPSYTTLEKMAAAFNVSIDEILRRGKLIYEEKEELSSTPKELDDYHIIPLVSSRLKDGAKTLLTEEDMHSNVMFQKGWISRSVSQDSCVLMQVEGNSMSPTLNEGDMVLIDIEDKTIFPGKLYAVSLGNAVLIRRIDRLKNTVRLLPDNNSHSPIDMTPQELKDDPDIQVLGRVLWSGREH